MSEAEARFGCIDVLVNMPVTAIWQRSKKVRTPGAIRDKCLRSCDADQAGPARHAGATTRPYRQLLLDRRSCRDAALGPGAAADARRRAQAAEQKALEERSFLQKFERILLGIDASSTSHLAERIAGHFVAVRRMPVTVLDIVGDDAPTVKSGKTGKDGSENDPKAAEARAEDGAGRVKAAADDAVAKTADPKQPETTDIHITTRIKDADLCKILGEGAEKGHDLLFIGVEPTMAADGGFHEQLSVMTSAFKGTTAIVSSCGELPVDNTCAFWCRSAVRSVRREPPSWP